MTVKGFKISSRGSFLRAAMTRGEHGSLIEAAVHDIHHVI
jgi:hypothetical protein